MLTDLDRYFDYRSLAKGHDYFESGHVLSQTILEDSDETLELIGRVLGSKKRTYIVVAKITKKNTRSPKLFTECTCPVTRNCKHAVALLMVMDNQKEEFALTGSALIAMTQKAQKPQEEPNWQHHFKSYHELMEAPAEKTTDNKHKNIAYLLTEEISDARLLKLEPKRGTRKPGGVFAYAKSFSKYHNSYEYEPLAENDKRMLGHLYGVYKANSIHRYFSNENDPFVLNNKNFEPLLSEIITSGACYWGNLSQKSRPLTLGDNMNGSLTWQLAENGEQSLKYCIDEKPVRIFRVGDRLCIIDEKNCIFSFLNDSNANAVLHALKMPAVGPRNIKSVSDVINKLPIAAKIPLPHSLTVQSNSEEKCQPIVVFSGSSDVTEDESPALLAWVSFAYGKVELVWHNPEKELYTKVGAEWVKTTRDFTAEAACLDQLLAHGMSLEKDEENVPYFIIEPPRNIPLEKYKDQCSAILDDLDSKGWIVNVGEDFFLNEDIEDPEFYANLTEESQYGWFNFEIGIEVDGEKLNLLPTLLYAIDQGAVDHSENLRIKLENGRIVILEGQRLKQIIETLTELFDKNALNQEGHLLVSKQRAAFLNHLKDGLDISDKHWSGWEPLQNLRKALSNEGNCILPLTIPTEFNGKLREYQQAGVNWLGFLANYELGGVLADDMGLGKTVQVLAFLLHQKLSNNLDKPCLVIVPTSLVNNWMAEAARFTPELRILSFHGASRRKHQQDFENYDLILTTYPLMIHDNDIHSTQHYHTVILDEAQAIKNPDTLTTKNINSLKSDHRLCLTGTPMENHLGELWSLFNFLMPGFLGSKKQFTRIFRTPIEKHQDLSRRTQLAARIKPFMLRRTKELVAKDLPPKIEMTQLLTLSPAQRDLYESIRLSMEVKVRSAIASKGLASSQIIILDALLKLRQVCTDPRVMKIEAAKTIKTPDKLAWLLETMPTFMEEGRKLLIFSSFVTVLRNIAKELENNAYPFVMLNGQTKDRKTPVERFQNKEVPIFLISLKAGGVGLNLTAADTIIHFDPWWNPAAQAQATDRAHRIGQEKTVFVYQLVAKDTVEEKIMQMQEKKAALLANILTPEKDMSTALTSEDVLGLFKAID